MRPIGGNDFENHDAQPLYQEPFASLNNANDNNDDTIYYKQSNTQEDLMMHHQQQQQLLMMQGVSMALDNKGTYVLYKMLFVRMNSAIFVINCHFDRIVQ